ncbi:MAG: filamentous hemagglutinin N-terminal domain-containing protein [Cyanophyceae cyanobacterium]
MGRVRWVVLGGVVIGSISSGERACAQMTPDSTLGKESSVVSPTVIRGMPSDRIDGGAQRGANLFHSFQDFNVGEGRGAYFSNPDGVDNIFSRVTGGNLSEILGTLGVLGEANLFLLNPNGLLFGPNASLDVNGSFVGTTANGIGFGEDWFSATDPTVPSQLLTVNPAAFFFNQVVTQPNTAIAVQGTLAVPRGQSLLLVGGKVAATPDAPGTIAVDGGELQAPGGRVELGGLAAAGTVKLVREDWQLSFPQEGTRADVVLNNGAAVDVVGNRGSIAINAQNLAVLGGSQLGAGINSETEAPQAQAGDIVIETAETVTLAEASLIANVVAADARGNGGNVEITTSSLSIVNGGQLLASTEEQGSSGRLLINASESMAIEGSSENLVSTVFSGVGPGAEGNGGNIDITTGSLSIAEGGRLSASTFGRGDAGQIEINASDVALSTAAFVSSDVGPEAEGRGGNITITAGSLLVKDALLTANTSGQGQAGNLTINASNIAFTEGGFIFNGVGEAAEGQGGRIEINANVFVIADEAQLSSSTLGQGDAGRLDITTDSLLLTNGGQLSANTFKRGNAGPITISARDVTVAGTSENLAGLASTISNGVGSDAEGNGSSIEITTGSLWVTEGAQVSANTFGRGDSGQITIRASESVAIEGRSDTLFSTVSSSVGSDAEGNGSGIEITTGSLSVTDNALLAVSTLGRGDAGQITIDAREIAIATDGFVSNDVGSDAEGSGGKIQITAESLALESGAQLSSGTLGRGDAGSIKIDTNSLFVNSGAQLTATTFGRGNAGQITINASESVAIEGRSDTSFSTVSSSVGADAEGRGGGIEITTGLLSVTDDALLSATTLGRGDAGQITINASESVAIEREGFVSSDVGPNANGHGGGIVIATDVLRVTEDALLSASTAGRGNAGRITINARDATFDNGLAFSGVAEAAEGNGGPIQITTGSLLVTNDARLAASTLGRGDAGRITINASDATFANDGTAFSGVVAGAEGDGGPIKITTGSLSLLNNGQISARASGAGKGGEIQISARLLSLSDGAQIESRSFGSRDSGEINLQVFGTLQADNSQILTSATQAAGGAIAITAGDIRLRGSDIRTSVSSGAGGGGNITLTANSILAFDDSDILAFAQDGQGGDIELQTPIFFGSRFQAFPEKAAPNTLDGNERVDIDASGAVSGEIRLPDVSFLHNSLSELPINVIDTETLIANSCVVPSGGQRGTFIITGAGGLPVRPGEAAVSSYPTGSIRSVPSAGSRLWQPGDPIVEPTGVHQLASGELVLSRRCR